MVDLADVGRIAVAFSLGLSAFALAASLIGLRTRYPELLLSARNALGGAALLTSVAVAVLAIAFLTRDFSIRFVAENSSRSMPAGLTIAALWGGQAGSLLYWSWILSLFAAAASARTRLRWPVFAPHVTLVLAGLLSAFLTLGVFAASPFEELPVTLPDGRGLNPLLWDRGMQIHPPLLLAGYVSFAVPFAFAVAALLSGALDRRWVRAARGWMLLAWGLQSAGLIFGAWWAYRVLGWGGYWGWDPVENVALIPWLVATAYLHSSMVQERRGMLKLWNISLAISAFILAVTGTFIVRSGILTSVHAFATSDVGPLLFGFLGLTLIASVVLVVYRLPDLRSDARFEASLSREAGFLFNNLLLVSIAAATFWGTMFPLISEAFRGTKMAVGAPFYSQVNGPLFAALILLTGLGPLLSWRRTNPRRLARRLAWPATSAGTLSLLLAALGMRAGLAVLAYAICAFTAAALVSEYVRGVSAFRRYARSGMGDALREVVWANRRRYGGYLVHLGVALLALGVIGSTFFKAEAAVALAPGGSAEVGGYVVSFERLLFGGTEDVGKVDAMVYVARAGGAGSLVLPGRRIYRDWESQPISMVGIRTMPPFLDDVYVLLTGWDEASGSATLRVIVNPQVSLLWIGALLYFAGALAAAWPASAPGRSPAAEASLLARARA